MISSNWVCTPKEGQESSRQFAIIISLQVPLKCRLHTLSVPTPEICSNSAWKTEIVLECFENVLQLFHDVSGPKSFRRRRVTHTGAPADTALPFGIRSVQERQLWIRTANRRGEHLLSAAVSLSSC